MRLLNLFPLFVVSTIAADVRTIYEFPLGTWLENVITLRNGSFLVSMIGKGEVHIINPPHGEGHRTNPSHGNYTSSLVHAFPGANSVLGMTELTDGVFAMGVGNLTATNSPYIGTFGIWEIDLNHRHHQAKVRKVSDIPNVAMVNGVDKFNDYTILIADCWYGNIVKVNTKTGASSVALDDASLKPVFNTTYPLGVNGLKFHDGYVYYSNTAQKTLNRVRVNHEAHAIGPFTNIASGPNFPLPDDLVVEKDGSVFEVGPVTAPGGGTLEHVTLDGNVTIIASGGPVAGVTAVRFGRTHQDRDAVYLSTMGGYGPNFELLAGGRLVRVKVY